MSSSKSIFDYACMEIEQERIPWLKPENILSVELQVHKSGTGICKFCTPNKDAISKKLYVNNLFFNAVIPYNIPAKEIFDELLELSIVAFQLDTGNFIFFLNDFPFLYKKIDIDYLTNVKIQKYVINYSDEANLYHTLSRQSFPITDCFKIVKCVPEYFEYLKPYNNLIKEAERKVKLLRESVKDLPDDIKLLLELE